MPRPTTATIDLAALKHNLGVVRRCAPAARAFAIIKANAYGHGLLRAARALAGADGFGLVELESAVRLRDAGYRQPILLLEGVFESSELQVLIDYRLSTVVHCAEQLQMLEDLPAGVALDVFVKFNTGMNRLGFALGQAPAVLAALGRSRCPKSVTVMTHFATADEPRGVGWQMEELDRALAGAMLPRCLANSAAILSHPETHADWVRPGIMLYGCSPFSGETAVSRGLRPVMTLASRVIAVQELQAGDAVGYGGLFRAERPTRVGVIACGYADGYPRHAPTGTPVMVAGELTRTLGRVSMDMLCVDLSDLPQARPGSPAILWGAEVPVEHVAAAAGTVGYELLCALAPRVTVIET